MTRAGTASGRLVVALATTLVSMLPSTAWPWGGATHHYIAQNYSRHLPAVIDGLRAYDAIVDQKVNDPDIRRPSTPGESYRHYIDIDRYDEFFLGTLPHDRSALEAIYGATVVRDNGIVPWAVGEVVTTLAQQFAAGQWSASATTIADLCHYVGDATQPLHCTENYDGQLSGNSGIHSRYESSMMATHIADLQTIPSVVTHYPSAVDAMFDIVGASWNGVATVIAADNAAKAASGGSFNSTYYSALWTSTESLTRARIDAATLATASFVYTAWINAGQPVVPGSNGSVDPGAAGAARLAAGPSPFREALTIRFEGLGPRTLEIFDVRGARVAHVVDHGITSGSFSWTPDARTGSGLYFVRLTTPGQRLVRRVTRLE